MNTETIVLEMSCFFVLLVILYGLLFESKVKNGKTRALTVCTVFSLLALVADCLSWTFDGRKDLTVFLTITNTCAISLGSVTSAAFGYYVRLVINEKREKPLPLMWFHYVAAANIICIVINVVAAITGNLFIVDADGIFGPGLLYSASAVSAALSMVYLLIFVLSNGKVLGIHDTAAFIAYTLLPMVGLTIELVSPGISLSLPSCAMAILILYVMLQAGQVAELHTRGQILNELSMKDAMTGLLNRRAFDMALESLKQEDVVGAVFCDVNGLKYTNDHYGHKAGDEWIMRLVELLRKNFSADSIFRISGDEFVVLIGKVGALSFYTRVRDFKAQVAESSYVSAVGMCHGRGKDVMDLVKDAEAEMYRDKEEALLIHPEYARK